MFGKFLDVDGESSAGTHDAEGSTADKKGQSVNLVIKDEDLPSEEGTGQYEVGSNHQMLNAEDIRGVTGHFSNAQNAYAQQSADSSRLDEIKKENNHAADSAAENFVRETEFKNGAPDGDKEFVPVRNLETLYNVSGKEALTKENPASVNQGTSSEEPAFTAEDEELDTLPTMDDLGIEGSSTDSYGEEGVNTDSDFATTSGGGSRRSVPENAPEVKDAPLLAKAISTILANES